MTQRHLLTTKIQIPPLPPKTVQRTRLLEALDRGLQANIHLTLLSAPAGYGKTTLLSAWVQDRGFPTAWLSLDEGDNVVAFGDYGQVNQDCLRDLLRGHWYGFQLWSMFRFREFTGVPWTSWLKTPAPPGNARSFAPLP